MDSVLQGFKDLRSVLQRSPKAPHPAQGKGYRGRGRTSRPNALAPMKEPFSVGWKTYCATNPRLRDPRALSTLMRHGVPDEFRADVWSHCLGIDIGGTAAASTSNVVATTF